jgi:hypothetical protein
VWHTMAKKPLLKLSLGLFVMIAFAGRQVCLSDQPGTWRTWANQRVLAQLRAKTETDCPFAHPNTDGTALSKPLAESLTGITPRGWKIYDEIKQFTPESLYQQINGRAELYKDYNVVTATFVNYENRSNEMHFIELAVYDMGNPTNAFGIFSVERDPGQASLGLGRDSCRSDGSYYIWKGQYYAQIIASDATQELQRIGMDLARKLTDWMTDSGEPVWGLTVLPREDRVPNSERYFRANAMGMRFMKNTYVAQYRKTNNVVTFFLSDQDKPNLARATVSEYIKFAQQFGEGVETLTIGGLEMLVCDMVDAYDVVFQKGPLVGGVSSVDDRKFAIQVGIDLWSQVSKM